MKTLELSKGAQKPNFISHGIKTEENCIIPIGVSSKHVPKWYLSACIFITVENFKYKVKKRMIIVTIACGR